MKIATLENVCYLNMGQSPDSSTYNEVGEGLPFYQGNADFGEKHPHCRVWCSEPTKIAEKEDILISVRAPIGALNEANERCCIGRGLAAIRPKGKINKDFLYYFLLSKKSYLISKGTGSTFKAISKNVLGKLSIPVPAMHEQEKRARILNTLWKVIYTRRVQLAKLDELVKCRFVEMFGDENNVASSEIRIGEIADVQVGIVIKPSQYYTNQGGVKAFRSLNVGEGFIKNEDWVYFSESAMRETQRTTAHTGDILVVRSGRPGTACIVTEEYNGCNVIDLLIVRPNHKHILPEYLCAFTNLPHGKNQIESQQRGIAQQHFNVGMYREMKIVVPPIRQQKSFVSFLTRIDKLRFK